MKGDFSRFSHDPSKHYVGVFMQQGRAQLDSDWNENVENFLHLLQKTSQDLLGRPACIGDSFRIGRDIPIDHMSNPNAWEPVDASVMQKQYYIFLNSYDRPRSETRAAHEKGSLFVQKTRGIMRRFKGLDLSKFRTICLKFKPVEHEDKISDKHVKLYLTSRVGRREITYEWSEKFAGSRDAGGFYTIEYDLTRKPYYPSNNDPYDLSNISSVAIRWNFDGPVSIGVISGEPLATIIGLKPAEMFQWENSSKARYSLSTIGRGKKEDNNDHLTKSVLRKAPGITSMQWKSQVPINLGLFKTLHFQTTKDLKDAKLAITKHGGKTVRVIPIIKKKSESNDNDSFWHYYTADLRMHPKSHVRTVTDNSSSINILEIESLEILNLPKDELLFSEFLGELDLQNNFIISSELELGGSSRMYVNGILCESEYWQTYLTQPDYPMPADHLALSPLQSGASNEKNETTSYMVFADVWQRGITHIEDPALREVALGGPDTSTRLETVCQIKLREIPTGLDFEGQLRFAEEEISKIKGMQLGRLGTLMRDSRRSLEDNLSGDYPALDNRLYRIQIHDAGDKIRKPATFKWSKNNGSTRFRVLQLNEFSVEINLSSKATGSNIGSNNIGIGDLIEIVDDTDELYRHSRGELRRITNVEVDVDRNTTILHWGYSKEEVEEEGEQQNVEDYPHVYDPITRRYFSKYHPKVIRWDGISRVNGEGDDDIDDESIIPLYDEKYSNGDASVAIRFEQGIFQIGDYWNFTTRTANGVENLESVPPRGIKHEFALLALIKKDPSKIEIIDDCRHEARPFWHLHAIDIAYDGIMPDGSTAANLHSAIQFLSGNIQNFQRHALEQQPQVQVRSGSNSPKAKGYGTIANLCVQAGEDDDLAGRESKQIFFEYSYDHQPLLLYNVTNQNGAPIRCRIDDLRTGKANPKYEGFSVTAEEDSRLSWISIGSSPDYMEDLIEGILERLSKKQSKVGAAENMGE